MGVIGEPNGFPITPLPVCARRRYFDSLSGNMTLVAASISGRDAVLAVDGLAFRSDGTENQEALKICQLRRGVLIAWVGDSSHAKYILRCMNPAAENLNAVSVFEEWERAGLRCSRGYANVQRDLWRAYRKLAQCLHEEDSARTKWPECLVVARRAGGISFAIFRMGLGVDGLKPEYDARLLWRWGSCCFLPSLGVYWDDPAVVQATEETKRMRGVTDEERLVRHIRAIRANSLFGYKANDNILTRRLSDRSRRRWHLAASCAEA